MRRARGRGIAILLVLSTVALIALDVRTGFLTFVGDAFEELIGVVQVGVRTVASPLTNTLEAIGRYDSVRNDNRELEAENEKLLAEIRQQQDVVNLNNELRRLLELSERSNVRILTTGEVIASSPSAFENVVTINRGSNHRVRTPMAVIAGGKDAAGGLIGRIISESPSTSRVQLITDPGSRVGVTVAGSSEFGLLRGQGRSKPLLLELIDPTAIGNGVEVGDQLFTLGGDELLFPSGISIGRITEISVPTNNPRGSKIVYATPIVRLSSLSIVSVVTVQTN